MSPLKSILGAAVLTAIVVAVLAIGLFAFKTSGRSLDFMLPVWAAVFLALFIPLAVIANRAQVRVSRIELIDLFARTFKLKPYDGDYDDLASFEFVRGKYFVDLPASAREGDISSISKAPFQLQSDWMLLFCAIPYIVFSGFGMFILFAHVGLLTGDGAVAAWLRTSLLAGGGLPQSLITDPAALDAHHLNLLAVAGFAFAGAYFFTVRLFLRAVVAFDLSPVTFLRAFLHMMLAVILAVVAFRVMPSAADLMAWADGAISAITGGPAADAAPIYDPKQGISPLWFFLAFALGFIPEAALSYVLQRSGVKFKGRYDELESEVKIVPVTVIDGIDHAIAFRLEECNIFDIQNLAVSNPIMLHIESPFGIYTTIDWVAQAQLCLEFGPDRFLALKTLNIRTIFDLEQVLKAGPSELVGAVADLLLQDCTRDRSARKLVGLSRPPSLMIEPGQEGAVAEEARQAALRALVSSVIGDLHVLRLKQLRDRVTISLTRDHKRRKLPAGDAITTPPPKQENLLEAA